MKGLSGSAADARAAPKTSSKSAARNAYPHPARCMIIAVPRFDAARSQEALGVSDGVACRASTDAHDLVSPPRVREADSHSIMIGAVRYHAGYSTRVLCSTVSGKAGVWGEWCLLAPLVSASIFDRGPAPATHAAGTTLPKRMAWPDGKPPRRRARAPLERVLPGIFGDRTPGDEALYAPVSDFDFTSRSNGVRHSHRRKPSVESGSVHSAPIFPTTLVQRRNQQGERDAT